MPGAARPRGVGIDGAGHRKSHVSHVVLDSEWEAELARVLEAQSHVVSYAKNQGMQFEVPYRRIAR